VSLYFLRRIYGGRVSDDDVERLAVIAARQEA
jgi:hypothetical protein